MNSTSRAWLLWTVVLFCGAGCGGDDPTAPTPEENYQQIITDFDLRPLPELPYPENNAFNAVRVALGKLLFFDPILGGESAPWVKQAAGLDPYRFRANDMACATCHFPTMGFADGRRLGAGVGGAQYNDSDLGPFRVVPGRSIVTGEELGLVPRNSPSCLNTACNGKGTSAATAQSFQFHDGRVAGGLEEQATLPITSRDEMAGDAYGPGVTAADIQDSVTVRIRGIPEYVDRFRQAFSNEVSQAADIQLEHIARAIAAYERELVTPGSLYDRFVGGVWNAFDRTEKKGFELFFSQGRCGSCHFGPMLSDFAFHVQGVADDYDSLIPGFGGKNGEGGDFGRFHADPVEFADQKYAFRTLTIRNVEVTGPYFHSGSAGTLREVVEFHNRGGRGPQDMSDAELDAVGVSRHVDIVPLGLTSEEMDAIVAFMKTTSAPVQVGPLGIDLVTPPRRVPSGLLPPGEPTPSKPGPYYPEPVANP